MRVRAVPAPLLTQVKSAFLQAAHRAQLQTRPMAHLAPALSQARRAGAVGGCAWRAPRARLLARYDAVGADRAGGALCCAYLGGISACFARQTCCAAVGAPLRGVGPHATARAGHERLAISVCPALLTVMSVHSSCYSASCRWNIDNLAVGARALRAGVGVGARCAVVARALVAEGGVGTGDTGEAEARVVVVVVVAGDTGAIRLPPRRVNAPSMF